MSRWVHHLEYINAVGLQLIDTGSSLTWIGNRGAYVKSSSTQETGQTASESYVRIDFIIRRNLTIRFCRYGSTGSGVTMNGPLYLDGINLGGLTIPSDQGLVGATTATGFPGDVDGIIGLGPTIGTVGTVANNPNIVVRTPVDTAQNQGIIASQTLGVYFQPITSTSSDQTNNGVITFGGVDATKFTGAITYAPKTSVDPYHWSIQIDSFSVGSI